MKKRKPGKRALEFPESLPDPGKGETATPSHRRRSSARRASTSTRRHERIGLFGLAVLATLMVAGVQAVAQRISEPQEDIRTPAGDVPYTIDDTTKSADPHKPDMLDRLENELMALDAELESLADRVGEGAEESLREARGTRMAVRQKLEQVRAASQSEWQSMKPALDRAVENLKQAVAELRSRARPVRRAPEDPTP